MTSGATEGDRAEALLHAVPWDRHPLGPIAGWPRSLLLALRYMMASPDAMYLVWGDSRTFFFNDPFAPVLGPRLKQAMGADFITLWADAWPTVQAPFERAMAGEASRFTDMFVPLARYGEPEATWWSFTYVSWRDEADRVMGVLCTCAETTDRLVDKRALREAEDRNRQILDSATDYAIIATDLNGIVTRWNEGARRIFDWTQAEMIGEPVDRFFTPEDVAAGRVAAEMRSALETGRGTDERWHQRKGGERFWANGEMTVLRDAAGDGIGFVKVLRDRTEQHRATADLARSERSLRRAQEAGRIGVFSLEIASDILTATPEFCHLFGLPVRASFPIDDVERLVIAEDGHLASTSALRVAGDMPLDTEYRIRRADTGAERWIARRGEFERDADGRAVRLVGVVQDVTDRYAAHRALADSEAKFRAFTEAVPNQIWSARPDGVLDWANRRAYEYNGVDRSRPRTDNAAWRAHVHPDDHPAVIAAWGRALQSGDPYDVEFRLRRADGIYRWHLARALPLRDADGTITRWLGSNTDIDDQRAAREALVDMNAALAVRVAQEVRERDRLWSTTNDLMGTAGFDGRLHKINPAWGKLLGYDDETLLRCPYIDLVDPADHPAAADTMARLMNGEAVTGFVDHLRTSDGASRAVMWSAVPDGDVFHIVGRDVTEQHDYEARLRQSQKMEAVGQLTGGIAHDFNNMLTGVIGSLDLLKRHLAAGRTDRVERYIDAATTSAQRAAALTQRLLAFSRRQSLDVRAVDVPALIAGMEDLLHRTLGENIALQVAPDAGTWSATTDANQLESALLNLALNARDAMPNGGRLTIETHNTRLDAAYAARVEDLLPGEFVAVSVSDTGIGMSSAVIAKAFDPFFTTKPIGEGTGLGLSMIYGFAKQSGGHVRMHSQPDEGTTVTLYLPRDGNAPSAVDAPTIAAPPLGAGERILLVEDDPAVRMLVTDVLCDLGYDVTQAADGREALPLIDTMERIDLLVTDVGLPGMNGREVAEIARARRPGLKVLFVTGYAEQAAVRGDFLGEGMDMIAKPFAIDDLSAKIRSVLGSS